MQSNVRNEVPYLRTSRSFPYDDIKQLTVELNKAYVDTANAVNNRTISIFPTNRPCLTGEAWFRTSQKQQSFRQAYFFSATTAIPHLINFEFIYQFCRLYGQFTDGTNWYGLIAGSNVAIAGQISFYLDGTNINFLSGAGAPTLTNGNIVLEYLVNV